jgi:anhydro-N-acetylmuramic acid kinase
MRVLGFMSGTSLDAVDMAVLETDGETLLGFGPAGERPLSERTRRSVLQATEQALRWPRGAPEPEAFEEARRAVAEEHLAAAREFLEGHGLSPADLDLVGFHGQTVLHERPAEGRLGRTVQLGDAGLLAKGLGRPVAYDFRTADVAAGGEGAPLAPIYHRARALASGLEPPSAVLNLGGVANVTFFGSDGSLTAFDTGPANGLIDLWVQSRTGRRFDEDGALAAAGSVCQAALERLLGHSYFSAPPPKSLDRYDISLAPLEGLSLEDGAATLTAFTARSVALGLDQAADPPSVLVVSGGGRRNPVLMRALGEATHVTLAQAEDLGWRGDAIEAEAFAFLAARTFLGLPISFPGTTGAPQPLPGGRLVVP